MLSFIYDSRICRIFDDIRTPGKEHFSQRQCVSSSAENDPVPFGDLIYVWVPR